MIELWNNIKNLFASSAGGSLNTGISDLSSGNGENPPITEFVEPANQNNLIKTDPTIINSQESLENMQNNALNEDFDKKEEVNQQPIEQNQPQASRIAQIQLLENKQDNAQETIKVPEIAKEVPILPETKENQVIKALKIAILDKFNPLCVYTQMYHESGAFKKPVGIWNYAGLKMPRQLLPDEVNNGWGGKTVKITTHETINGISQKLDDYFVDFSSAENLVKFYCFQVKRLFKEAYKNRNDYKLYFWWMTRDKLKYATDPNYSEKLIKLYAHLKADGMEETIDKTI